MPTPAARSALKAQKESKPSGPQLTDSEKTLVEVEKVEVEIAELRAMYEQFFLGIERQPPRKKHDMVKKSMKALKGTFVRQTALKFRINNLQQKLTTYERLWDKTMLEIENGTYKRDLFKAKLHDKKKKKTVDGDDFHVDEDLDISDLEGSLEDAAAEAEAAVDRRAEEPEPEPEPEEAPPPKVPSVPTIRPLTPPVPANAVAAATAAGKAGPPPAAAPDTNAPVFNAKGMPVLTAALPTGVQPAFVPGGAKPATGMQPVLKPLTTGVAPALSPPGAAKPAATGVAPALKPLSTGVQPAFKPGATSASATGLKPVTGVQPAVKPPGTATSTSSPGLKPVTGVQPALKPGGAAPAPSGPRAPVPGARPSAPAAPVSASGGLSDQKVKAIYDAYMMAKRRCGEDTSSLSLASVGESLRKQVPELMKQHGAKSVDFKVVIKDGKAVLRAMPKE